MEWDKDTRRRLAREIRRMSRDILIEECRGPGNFQDMVERAVGRIMEKLRPLGFEPANRDWLFDEEYKGENLYRDSPTHLWLETAQGRIVKIDKTQAERILVLGVP